MTTLAESPSTGTTTATTPTPPASETITSSSPAAPPTILQSNTYLYSPHLQAPPDLLENLDPSQQSVTATAESNFVVNEFMQQEQGTHTPVELAMGSDLERLKLEDCTMDDSGSSEKETMPPPPTPPLVFSVPSPAQVFAPRPVRPPWPLLYRPIPQRLQKPLVVLEESPIPRTPSPNRVTSPVSPTSTVVTCVGGGLVQAAAAMHRRSSSASIVGTDAAMAAAAWNMVSMKLTEPRLAGGETSEVQVCVNEESGKERNEKEGIDNLVQLYSPSKDVLDELYKIIRNNRPHTLNINQFSTTSPLYRATSPLVHPRAMTPQQKRERGLSDSPSSPLREFTRSPAEWAGKIPFPSSPISRTAMRNPIIYNPQFAQTTEQLGGLATS